MTFFVVDLVGGEPFFAGVGGEPFLAGVGGEAFFMLEVGGAVDGGAADVADGVAVAGGGGMHL